MSEKRYIIRVRERSAAGRSKRLRGQAVSVSGGGGTPTQGWGPASSDSLDGHTHANKESLDQIGTDADGYGWLTREVETTDPESGDTVSEERTEKMKAGYADEAGQALRDGEGNVISETYARVAELQEERDPVFQEWLEGYEECEEISLEELDRMLT